MKDITNFKKTKKLGFTTSSRGYLGLALASLGVTALLSPALVNTSKIFLKSGDSTVKESRNLMGINLARVNTSSLTSTSLANPRSRRLGEPAPQVLPLIPIAIGIAIGLISAGVTAVLFATAYKIATSKSDYVKNKIDDADSSIKDNDYSKAKENLDSAKEGIKQLDSSLEELDKLVEKINDKNEKKDAVDKVSVLKEGRSGFADLIANLEKKIS